MFIIIDNKLVNLLAELQMVLRLYVFNKGEAIFSVITNTTRLGT